MAEAKITGLLTREEIAELAAVERGADVWGYGNAKRLRSVEKKAPHLIRICEAMEKPPGRMRQPYFGAIATEAGRAALASIKGISASQAVLALKELGRSVPATEVAQALSVDSRAVATALRQPTKDGRVSITYRRGAKGEQRRGFYRFLRLTAK